MKALINKKLNGIEIYFDKKPEEETREALKSNSFKWNHKNGAWYTKNTAEAQKFVRVYFDIEILEEAGEAPKETATEKKKVSLWDRLNIESIPKHEYTSELKNITAETRKHFKNVFPELKISCTTGGSGWARYNKIFFELKAAPYSKEAQPEIIEAIEKYVKTWLWSYNYDNSDSMTDYFDRGFYESIRVDDFSYIEPKEEQTKDIYNFYVCLDLQKKAAEEEERIKFEEYRKEKEEAEKRFKERQAREAKQAEEIKQHIKVVDINENNKYLITANMLCGIGKENSLKELYEEEEYNKRKEETALIKREIYFTDETIYNYFCEMFLNDFEFLAGCGGTGTFDKRVTDENFNKLNTRQRENIKWILWDCVAVYLNNKLKLIIDPEGFSYARYVFVIENEYKKELAPNEESQGEGKEENAFHIPAPIAEQAEGIKENNKYTIIAVDPWILSAQMKHVKITDYKIKDYAQYKNSLYIEYIEEGKRKTASNFYHDGSELLIYAGHLPEVPAEILYKQISDKMQLLRYSGGESFNFMIDCIKYYKSIGIEPIINTLQY